jgi:hypothetical protein
MSCSRAFEGRRTWSETLEEMQTVLDQYLVEYNTKGPHQGRGMNGRTPITAFIDGIRKDNTPQPNPTPQSRLTRAPAMAARLSQLPSL